MAKTRTTKKPASKPSSKPTLADPTVPEAVGSHQDFERFLPAAQSLDARDVRPFRADASLAYHNVATGIEALLLRESDLRAELPTLDIEALRALPHVALAVSFAASQVDRNVASPKIISGLLRRAHPLRRLLLTSASALAEAKVFSAAAVTKILAGRGQIDTAQDCIDLAALFTKSAAAAKGKTAVTAAQVQEAAAVGTQLVTLLRAKGTKRDRSAPPDVAAAAEARDRIWTLLVQGHDRARRAAMWLWGDDADEHVPPLQSRVVAKKPARAKPLAQPAAPPA